MEVVTKKIGGSLAIIIPKRVVLAEKIKPNEKVRVEFKKGLKIGDIMGLLKGWSITTDELIRESKKGWK